MPGHLSKTWVGRRAIVGGLDVDRLIVALPQPVHAGDDARHDWDRLMAAAQAGDTGAGEMLIASLAPWLRRYFSRRLPAAMTEDAVQDVLLAVYEKRETYDPSRPFAPWFAAIARHNWIDRLRGSKIRLVELLDDTVGIPDHAEAVIAVLTFNRLLAGLKPSQAEAIRLVKLEGYSVKEASEALGQSASLIKVNIHRGLNRMASFIRTAGDADGRAAPSGDPAAGR